MQEKLKSAILMYFAIFHSISCEFKSRERLFTQVPAFSSGVTFNNKITTNDTLNALNFDYIYNGGGVAVGDINNDGLLDLFFAGNMVSNKLFLNEGNFKFKEITKEAGLETDYWATGVAMVDVNADGWLDIYVCVANKDPAASRNKLFINNGDASFTEMAKSYGLDDDGYSTQAAFFDFDKDGDLDVYILTNAYVSSNRNHIRAKKTDGESPSTDRLYRNNGDGTFTNVSRDAGILIEGYGLGVAIADINRDGWPDVYVANDFITNDLLWINNGDGTFTDQALKFLKHQSFNGMGVDIADFNNDCLVDIVVMDMLPPDNLRQKTMFPDINYNQFKMILSLGYMPQYVRNTLQLNNGNGTFSEISYLAGVHETDWSWAPLFADFNNSGFKDLFITNGYRKDVTNLDFIVYNREIQMFGTEMANRELALEKLKKLPGAHLPNFMFRNTGTLEFENVSMDWGFDLPTYSNGAAFADLDNDGDLDLVINNIDLEATIYRNLSRESTNSNFIQLDLQGEGSNPQAIGTKITLHTKDGIQFHEHFLQRGYKSTVTNLVHFGLGNRQIVDSIEIVWPSGKTTVLTEIPANQKLKVHESDGVLNRSPLAPAVVETIFEELTGKDGLEFVHRENDYADFYDQALLPHKFSRSGPGIAVGDINSDGMEDFYVGGAAGYPGRLFIQNNSGFYGRDFPFHPEREDMGVLFFDADQDGDLDLYVVSGGSSFPEGSIDYIDRLYVNDGKGNFEYAESSLPDISSSGSVVAAADFDRDGDLDLFVGCRFIPGKYPMPCTQRILKNDRGTFSDVTESVLPNFDQLGLVTDAIWTDFNNDSWIDLILVGEWMPVTFFKNNEGKLVDITLQSGLGNSKGWWNSITAGDFNEDGNVDFILGNLGKNSKFKASCRSPLRLYAADFDKNKSVDPIMSRYIQGREYPTHPRDNLISQIPSMKRRFTKFETYGQAEMDRVLSREERDAAYKLEAVNLQSALLTNLGDGQFQIEALPLEAQISPVYGSLIEDFDGDGKLDVLLTGNSYASEVHSGWYDAGVGLLLLGDGKGGLKPVHHRNSGFFVDTDAKGMASIFHQESGFIYLSVSNEGRMKAFGTKQNHQIFTAEPLDWKVIFRLQNGKTRIRQIGYGSTYLSQGSRKVPIPPGTLGIEVLDSQGHSRFITNY